MEPHSQIIEKRNKDTFPVLPLDKYEQSAKRIQDYEDLMDLRKAKENAKGQKGIPLDQAISGLGM
uniref:Uncharacterized protein n=1 Tax=Candidatus Kentrum sp. TC TaxID=2126339 RepID=A0A450YLK2_9GAMM|nr:MAG: hypothetical protein BECKTC1821D_GA0114238_101225 [Candidatus Kentron sp. TC]VFK59206.1 MAG: hypothetical protein BECKTC1821F_GA0114240_103024 [Candidatus Kentron sp. TC]